MDSMRNQEEQQKSNNQTQNNGQIPSPRPITRSEPGNPYPTTFVQADTNSFKQVVQMLTGSLETSKQASTTTTTTTLNKSNHHHNNIPPIKSITTKQQGFKLYERRNSLHKNLNINPLSPTTIFSSANNNSSFSPRNKPEILSPSILDFPSLVLSPVTPLIPDPFNRSGSNGSSAARSGCLNAEAEDKAIKEKGFFLHPSPVSTPRDSSEPPRLLPLFPTTSPRAYSSSSSSSGPSSSNYNAS
ncbi:hypothetical protein TSUD_387440 [Trifolium subterraneum]|uniref:VQ domain-containing protein n=1 Tax=Trifolium subterraneum TaxID=3900 RepID=A0A2Z6NGH3_TRISU|nr:hypothetical protein TSUD_387440 [Trifolium subterraneum]